MKNKNKLTTLINLFILFFFTTIAFGDEFNFKSSEIIFLDNGNTVKGVNGVDLTTNNGIRITGEQFNYDKIKTILKVNGNVVIYDTINKLILKSQQFTYLKEQETIFSKTKVLIEYKNEYFLESNELTFNRNDKIIFSEKEVNINDVNGNTSSMSSFELSLISKILKGDDLKYLDISRNKIFIKQAMVNLTTKEIVGKDTTIEFENSSFGNIKNQPRLKGNSIYSSENKTEITKSTFTTCKKRDGCPPWTLSASKITHDQEKKIINYKDIWLKLYDYPVFYFPRFFHPDPSVERQSGFLIPKFSDSNLIGTSLSVPYFNAVSDNKDLTFNPIFFTDKSALFQTEYREVKKNSNHVIDLSYFADNRIKSDNYSTKSHFFSSSKFNLELDSFTDSSINMNLQQVSNDNYLKMYKLKSPLITNEGSLHSFIEFNGSKKDSNLNISTEVYEDTTKNDHDRYEYILPNFNYIKKIYPDDFGYGHFSFESMGYQKQNNTNINETSLINNLYLYSSPLITNKGFLNKYVGLIKNVNNKTENSTNLNKDETKLLSILMFEMTYPVKKEMNKYDNIFTPILSMRYSPNKTRNITNIDRKINTKNIYSIDRLGEENSVEGGQSITLGSSFKKIDKLDNNFFTFDLATTFRDIENKDLPLTTTMGEKHSDFVGNITFDPNNILGLSYDFSYDNNLKYSNYDSLKTKFEVNNFFTEFEFLEENNLIGSDSYLANKSRVNISDDQLLSYSTRRNRKTNLTEYYNLMYEYKNDCLIASIKYKKDYYNDGDIKPEEQLFFSLTIVPFSTTDSPNINK